jgi:hypothetical protein
VLCYNVEVCTTLRNILLLLVDWPGVGTSFDSFGGEGLSPLVELAEESVCAGSVGLAVPLLVVPGYVSMMTCASM